MFRNTLLDNGLIEKMLDNYSLPVWNSTISSPVFRNHVDNTVDIDYKNNKIHIMLPGFSIDEINLEIVDKYLVVSSTVSLEETTKFKNSFEKKFILGEKIDVNSIEAKYNAGILSISYESTTEKNQIRVKITE